jgi:hypothetical protein
MVRRRTRPLRSSNPYTALIGDMLASRSLASDDRSRVQEEFNNFIDLLNRKYREALLSDFVVTLGDEFQGILRDPTVISDLIWDTTLAKQLPQLRLGIGFGRIDTAIPVRAINLDGPALHNARAAVDLAKKDDILGGVFYGFGEMSDTIANGIARLLRFHVSKRSDAQLQIIELLRNGHSQTEIAKMTGRTPQAINAHKSAAGWEAFSAGDKALQRILQQYKRD